MKVKTYPKLQRARIATCPICLKEFRAVKDQNGKFGGKIRKQIYCSKECWSKRNPPKAKKCYYCGKTYMSYEIETRVYCSKECRDLDYRERFKGEEYLKEQLETIMESVAARIYLALLHRDEDE